MPTQTLHINARPPSLNQMYSGKLKDRIRCKKTWLLEALAAVQRSPLRRVERYPVEVRFRVEYGPAAKRQDVDNLAAAVKVLTDILVKKCKVLENDSPKYISRVVLGPCTRGKMTRCTYEIIEPETP